MRHWHAAYTRPSAECQVNDSLRARGIETLFLHELHEVHHARQVTMARRPLFSRYVVAAVDFDDDLSEIRDTPGVVHIVSSDAGPLSIKPKVISGLQALANKEGLLNEPMRLPKGTPVRVRTGGPLEPFLAFVLLDSGDDVRVRMRMFKRWVTGKFDRRSIEVVHSPERPPVPKPAR